MQASVLAWMALVLIATAFSALVTWASIAYAHRMQLIDHPGRRRSHVLPTPRGGGIGIVAAALLGLGISWLSQSGALAWNPFPADGPVPLYLMASVALVAIVGWVDDHRGLGAWPRLIAHLVAVLLLGMPDITLVGVEMAGNPAAGLIVVIMLVCALATVWSINLHNFMDGINGLLALQATFVFGVLAWICAQAGQADDAGLLALFAAATLGFLPFNFPRARVFMGDVGSGVLGLLVAVAVGWQIAAAPALWMAGLIAVSAFVVDSTCTLLSRLFSGRRWYSAHREHLYQWLARCGFGHAGVVGLYMGWNLLVVLPALAWIGALDEQTAASAQPGRGNMALPAVYMLAVLAWIAGKHYCLGKIRVKGP